MLYFTDKTPKAELKEMRQQGVTKFWGTWTPGYDFSGLDLRGVEFNCSNLSGCNFTNCQLDLADFQKADLTGADFTGATGIERADFRSAKTEGVKGAVLETRWVTTPLYYS